ncbi:MAG: 5'-nucleotidase, lipoprotein e(P4) family, partial [Bacteroidetes bacterium]|nr:5'-nucleotidase, lipoprotein e(P4) family [Bacteroidota bacterium]
SPYEAKMIEKGFSYSSKTWKEWTKLAIAKPLPGVIDFLTYAKSKGVEAFFVSNRETDERDATLKNMINEKIPFADTTHMYLKGKQSDKTARYNEISKKYKIILTIGDNLRDFNEVFGTRKNDYGMNLVDSLKTQLSENFILLPNPMYGDWEKAIYGGKFPSEPEKNKMRKLALKSY